MKHRHTYPLLLLLAGITGLVQCSKEDGSKPNPPSERKTYTWTNFIMGADLSSINAVEDFGAHFTDSGVSKNVFDIFRSHGANLVRARLWHNPKWQATLNGGRIYSDLADVEHTFIQARAKGMALLLDMHFSDTWADPAHQDPPAAWAQASLSEMADSVYQYTLAVLTELKSKSLVPELIQLGNEINSGMLFPNGAVQNNDWSGLGALLHSAISAVRDFSASSSVTIKIMLHVAQFQNADYWLNGIMQKALVTDFDIVGVSHYFPWSALNTMAEVGNAIKALHDKYGKDIIIAETAYPWTAAGNDHYANLISGASGAAGYAVTASGQYQYLHDLTQQVISGGGKGIIYWEPAWVTSSWADPYGTGSPWENNAFFDFSGNSLPVMNFMSDPYHF